MPITGVLAYATRVDTLFKYLEKAPAATWEIVWVDGHVRTDLKTGDKLKVTAENGDIKGILYQGGWLQAQPRCIPEFYYLARHS